MTERIIKQTETFKTSDNTNAVFTYTEEIPWVITENVRQTSPKERILAFVISCYF